MATGLSRKKNLSEKNLNLKNAIQKLYAPGIENDIELFSLSSKVESSIVSGPLSNKDSQIIGFRNEFIKDVLGNVSSRTKFLTKYFTYTDNNKVYFSKFDFLTGPSSQVTPPIYSINQSLVNLTLFSEGNGYYFTDLDNNPIDLGVSENIIVNNVKLLGTISGESSAIASVTFAPGEILGKEGLYSNSSSSGSGIVEVSIQHNFKSGDAIYFTATSGNGVSDQYVEQITVIDDNTIMFSTATTAINTGQTCIITPAEELDRTTPGIKTRYKVIRVTLIEGGENYFPEENIQLIPGEVERDGVLIKLNKQSGILYNGTSEILKSEKYFYEVRGASIEGFYLLDPNTNNYVFLDINTEESGFNQNSFGSMELRRSDKILGKSFNYFKFLSSLVYLEGYSNPYSSGTISISSEINQVSSTANSVLSEVSLQIQNTKLPTLVQSEDNELGHTINSFEGIDAVFWQRVVIRDQDYLLNPSDGITSSQLKDDVLNFKLPNGTKVPGVYLIFGDKYIRAFSTADKPFLSITSAGVLNPSIYNNGDKSISSEDTQDNGVSWYGYDNVIGEIAQRIDSNGINGALYYHKLQPPRVEQIPVVINNTTQTGYLIPMFNLV